MDSIDYVRQLGKKVQASFENGEEMTWSERIAKCGDEVFEYLPDAELEAMAIEERNMALDDYAAEEARR